MSSEQQNKLASLSDALYPIFLDRLKNEGHLTPKTPKPVPINDVFYPEIDYILHITRMRGEFRKARYTVGNAMKMDPRPDSVPFYGLEVYGGSEAPGYEHTLRKHIIIPSPALNRDIAEPYGVMFKHDYRLHAGSRTFYIKGVMDGKTNDPVKSNANCYTVDMRVPLTARVINNTRMQWESMPDYEKGLRIVTEDTMMHLLDRLESGDLVPNEIPWKLEVLGNGTYAGDKVLEDYDWIGPMKIGL